MSNKVKSRRAAQAERDRAFVNQPTQNQGTTVSENQQTPETPVEVAQALEAAPVEDTAAEQAAAPEAPVEDTAAAQEEAPAETAAAAIEAPVEGAAEETPAAPAEEVKDAGAEAGEGAMPALNVNTEMPQESDPIADGSMEAALDKLPTQPPAADVAELENIDSAVTEPDLSEEETYLNEIRISGTEVQKRMLAAIDTFCDQIRPKRPVEPEDGVKYQYEFLRHLLWLLAKDYTDFRGGWNVLLVYFYLNHGQANAGSYSALSELSATRFLFAWTKGEETCEAYRNLITLLRATRNKETRKHDIKTINLSAIAPTLLGDKEMDNLKKFYAV